MKNKKIILFINYILIFLIFITIFFIIFNHTSKYKLKEFFELKEYPPTFVISLKRKKDRREHITKEFNNNNIKNWEFFDAYEPTEDEMKKYSDLVTRGIKKGKIGVIMSHRLVWEKCIKLNKPIFIFEDDIYFDKFTYNDLFLLYDNKDKWDIAWLGHCYETKKEKIIGNFYNSFRPRCRHAYLITPKGARIMLDNVNFLSNGDEQMGLIIYEKKIKSLSLYPPTVNQAMQKKEHSKQFISDTEMHTCVGCL